MALDRLPADKKEILVLSRFQGMKYEELAGRARMRGWDGKSAGLSRDAGFGTGLFDHKWGKNGMNCDETKLILPEYLSESLGEAQELAFASHLATCEACRAETERLGSLWRGLALLPGTMPEPGGECARPVL